MTKVYLLHDGIYETVLSVHATKRGVKEAMKKHLDGAVTESAKEWWSRFGVGGEYDRPEMVSRDRAATLEAHIESERKVVERAFWVEEMELQ